MNVGRLLRHPVTVERVAATGAADAFGDPTLETTQARYRGWLWQEQRGDLDTAGRDLSFEQWKVALDPSAAGQIAAGDRVIFDGITYEVEGPPWSATNPRTQRVEYVEATLRRT